MGFSSIFGAYFIHLSSSGQTKALTELQPETDYSRELRQGHHCPLGVLIEVVTNDTKLGIFGQIGGIPLFELYQPAIRVLSLM